MVVVATLVVSGRSATPFAAVVVVACLLSTSASGPGEMPLTRATSVASVCVVVVQGN